MALNSYPHFIVNVGDNTPTTPVVIDQLPLHRPVYVMKAHRGRIGVPVWCPTITEARREFGDETFNDLNKTYFSLSSMFLSLATFPETGAFIVRVADDAATVAKLIYELGVITKIDGSLELRWYVRSAVTGVETDFNDLKVRVVSGATSETVYPIFAITASSAGAWGNDIGFRFSWDKKINSEDILARSANSLFYTMAPVRKDYNASTVNPIRTITTDISSSFVLQPDVVDSTYKRKVSIKDVLLDSYKGDAVLPVSIKVYSANIATVGDLIVAAENDSFLTGKPWLANILNALDVDGNPYTKVSVVRPGDVNAAGVNTASTLVSLNASSVQYMSGGSDGSLTDDTIETKVAAFFNGDVNPDIFDKARYPFTHVIDVGHKTTTKNKIADFVGLRDDVIPVLSTQVAVNGGAAATSSEDMSLAEALRTRLVLIPESIIKGTEAFRGEIFMHAGELNVSMPFTVVPLTLWRAKTLAHAHKTQALGEAPEGMPLSEVDLYKSINWVPSTEQLKALSWYAGANYVQFFTMTRLHVPAVRTVYKQETSSLVGAEFAAAVVYLKHEARQVWAIFSGKDLPASVLHSQIKKEMDERANRLLNGKFRYENTVYQTAEEQALGFKHHIQTRVFSGGLFRVAEFDIICERETTNG
jgi:hypothetical protein